METTIKVIREQFNDQATIGRLYIDDSFFCWTLEDSCREEPPGTWTVTLKKPKITAIPYGKYEMVYSFSKRFGRAMPLLLNVPDYDAIRIHCGNDDADTDGCILVGMNKASDTFIGNSQMAFSLLSLELQRRLQKGKIFVQIEKRADGAVDNRTKAVI